MTMNINPIYKLLIQARKGLFVLCGLLFFPNLIGQESAFTRLNINPSQSTEVHAKSDASIESYAKTPSTLAFPPVENLSLFPSIRSEYPESGDNYSFDSEIILYGPGGGPIGGIVPIFDAYALLVILTIFYGLWSWFLCRKRKSSQ